MSFTVLTAATEDWRQLLTFTASINRQWAETYGGKLVEATIRPDGRPAAWAKLKLIACHLKAPVIWVDADCVIRQEAMPVDFLAHPGEFRTAFDENGPNCGGMAFTPEAWTERLIHEWQTDATDEEIHSAWWEQTTLHRMLGDKRTYDRLGKPIPADSFCHASGISGAEKKLWFLLDSL